MASSSALGRLARLRSLLSQHSLSAYVIPSADAHQSEYVAPCDMRRAYISGFTGSAGTAVVTPTAALLWTDGRYFLQAEAQLDSGAWALMKAGTAGVPTVPEWLAKNVPAGGRVGFDPFLFSLAQQKSYVAALEEATVAFAPVAGGNLVDAVWAEEPAGSADARPAPVAGPISVQDIAFAGVSVADKLATLRAAMAGKKALAVIVSALDEVAWLLNLRGADIAFNPVFMSYVLVTPESATLFAAAAQFEPAVEAHLAAAGVTVRPYADAVAGFAEARDAAAAARAAGAAQHKIWSDASTTTVAVLAAIAPVDGTDADDALLQAATPITLAKAIKNEQELAGMRAAHVLDAVALCKFFAWLEAQLPSLPKATDSAEAIAASPLTEFSVAEKLEAFRREEPRCVGLSFDTISSIGPNGAVIHYKPEPETARPITTGQVFLLDSGGQYREGTTDITRTVFLARPGADAAVGEAETDGAPSAFQRRANTRVLQGHIALAKTPFPKTTMGPALDALARQFLWDEGLNYLHGTGHGVGAFLNVHEGPQGIAMMNRGGPMCQTPLEVGMVVSNEPGYYHAGAFGIRIENLVAVTPRATAFGGAGYLGLDNLTLVPFDRALIDLSLLSAAERRYVDEYHAQCRATVAPLLAAHPAALAWLNKHTEPL